MKNSFTINTKLDVITYTSVVRSIADSYFDINGNYQPHMGMFNAMRVFYNICIVDSPFENEIPHDFNDVLMVDVLAANEAFISRFNAATIVDKFCLDFANAYRDAMDIVDTKKSSVGSLVEQISSGLTKIVENVNGMLDAGEIDRLEELADAVSKHGLNPNTIIDKYKKSKAYRQNIAENRAADLKKE